MLLRHPLLPPPSPITIVPLQLPSLNVTPLVCPSWLSRHLTAATASQRADLLSPCLSLRHPLVYPGWLSRHPHPNTASQRVGWLYVASHRATLTFDPAGCCVTPCHHHRHPSQMRRHLAVHVTADENARAPEPAARPVYPGHSSKEPHHLPLEGCVRPSKSGLPRDVNPCLEYPTCPQQAL